MGTDALHAVQDNGSTTQREVLLGNGGLHAGTSAGRWNEGPNNCLRYHAPPGITARVLRLYADIVPNTIDGRLGLDSLNRGDLAR